MTKSGRADSGAVREAEARDAEVIREISNSSPEAAQWEADNYVGTKAGGVAIFVGELGGVVCGFVVFRVAGGECEILNLAVEPQQRRRGVATLLLAAALKKAREEKAEEAFLEVRESNAAAISFYASRGFRRIGERRRYYSSPTENAVLLKQNLAGQD